MKQLFATEKFARVVHLAAQAGVRYSIEAPQTYIDSNVTGTLNVLEGCRHNGVEHLVYASTSSVYGANTQMPFSVHMPTVHPLSFYAATKRANELMAHKLRRALQAAVHRAALLHRVRPVGPPRHGAVLVHQEHPRGQAHRRVQPRHHKRDFTFVEDIAEGVVRSLDRIAQPDAKWDSMAPDPATSSAPWRIYNIGNNQPVELLRYIEVLEECLGRKAQKNLLPLQLGDVPDTFADVTDLIADVGYRPATSVETGVRRFVDWYREYYRV